MSENLARELGNIWQEINRLRAIEIPWGAGSGDAGHWRFWAAAAVAGVAVTVVADGGGDVTAGLSFLYAVTTSGGAWVGGAATCANGASVNLYNVGPDTMALSIAVSGVVTVKRTAGALTYDVSILGTWQ